MASPNLLIDTSIVIEHLRKQNREQITLYHIVEQYELAISTTVEFELFMRLPHLQSAQYPTS